RLAGRQRRLPVVAGVDHEDAHRHAELVERAADGFLDVDRPLHQPVVLERGEAGVGHEPELIEEIPAGRMSEHPEMRRVLQAEPVLLHRGAGWRRLGRGSGRKTECGSRTGSVSEKVASIHDAALSVAGPEAARGVRHAGLYTISAMMIRTSTPSTPPRAAPRFDSRMNSGSCGPRSSSTAIWR